MRSVCGICINLLLTYLLAYLHTPLSRVLLEKLTGFQLVKKFSAFYGTRKFITAFTIARHLSISWASSIQSLTPHPTSLRSILILSSHLRLGLPKCSLPQEEPASYLAKYKSGPFVLGFINVNRSQRAKLPVVLCRSLKANCTAFQFTAVVSHNILFVFESVGKQKK